MTQLLERDEWVEAVGRSLLYDFLVRGLAYPTPERWRETRTAILPAVGELETVEPLLQARLVAAVRTASESDLGDLSRAHGSLFPPIESQDCPAYETAYRGSDVFQQAQIMADVAGFYRAHGLRAGGSERERPDHVTAELAFMQFLTRKEAYALEHLGIDRAEQCRATQALFLRDHLGCWAPELGARISATSHHPFFSALGLLLVAWLKHEMRLLRVEPAESAEPLPFSPPTPEGCGFDSGCPIEGACP